MGIHPDLSSLVFAFVEHGTLVIFPNKAAAILEFEGVDVESGTVTFYDAKGILLEPRFTSPNKRGRWLGLFAWVTSGTYELQHNASADQDSFALALHETTAMEPNQWFTSLEDLRRQLRASGVSVDFRDRPGNNEDP